MHVFFLLVGFLVSMPLLEAAEVMQNDDIAKFRDDKTMINYIVDKLQEFHSMKERLIDLETTVSQQEQKIKRLEDTVGFQKISLQNQAKTIRYLKKQNDLGPKKPKFDERNPILKPSENEIKKSSKVRRFLSDIQDGHVAFTAYLGEQLNNLGDHHALHFKHILLNEGKAYNNITGIFTCPISGVYLFSFFISEVGVHDTRVQLVVDGVNQVDAIVEGMNGGANDQGGNLAIIRLARGQSVWLEVYDHGTATSSAELNGNSIQRRNTFSGLLLFSDDDTGTYHYPQ